LLIPCPSRSIGTKLKMKTPADRGPVSSGIFGKLRHGLFTDEDPLHAHKILGAVCLAHFAYRTGCLAADPLGGDMAFGAAAKAVLPVMLILHASLSCSSIVFPLPGRRIREGSRIWPQFRLHSIVFAGRSLACMALVWADQWYPAPGGPRYWANTLIVFAALLAADAATDWVPLSQRSPTIRGLDAPPLYRYCFSLVQFLETIGCLVGLRSYAGQFAVVFVIQTCAYAPWHIDASRKT